MENFPSGEVCSKLIRALALLVNQAGSILGLCFTLLGLFGSLPKVFRFTSLVRCSHIFANVAHPQDGRFCHVPEVVNKAEKRLWTPGS